MYAVKLEKRQPLFFIGVGCMHKMNVKVFGKMYVSDLCCFEWDIQQEW